MRFTSVSRQKATRGLAFAVVLTAGTWLMPVSPAQAQTPSPFVTKLAETLEFTGFFQPRWQYTNQANAMPNNTFRMRRAEVYIYPTLNSRLKTRIGMDVVPTALTLKDVYMDFLISPKGYFTLRMGNWKKPFSREELRSSGQILMVDRGRTSEVFGPSNLIYQERDLGVAVLGDFYEAKVPFEYQFGVFNGNTANVATDADSRKSYVGRVEFVPVAGLSVGANVNLLELGVNRATGARDTLGYPGNQSFFRAKAYGVDMKFQKLGFILESEFRSGDNWKGGTIGGKASSNILNKTQINPDITVRGFYATAVYRIKTNHPTLKWVEPGVKYEAYDPNTSVDKDGTDYFTGYMGFYFFGDNIRLQLNAQVEKPQDTAKPKITTFAAQWTIRY